MVGDDVDVDDDDDGGCTVPPLLTDPVRDEKIYKRYRGAGWLDADFFSPAPRENGGGMRWRPSGTPNPGLSLSVRGSASSQQKLRVLGNAGLEDCPVGVVMVKDDQL